MRFFGVDKGPVELIIAANFMVYVLEWAMKSLIFEKFALLPRLAISEPWRLITSMFLHADISHLIFNMIALFFFGLYLERIIGEENFIRVYFIGGAFASISYVITSLMFNIPSPDTYAVGASGAIFAVMGALTVLRPNLTVLVYFLFPMPLYVLMIAYVLMSVPQLIYPVGNVAYNAHLGGIIAGYFFGRYFKERVPGEGGLQMYGYRFY